MVIPPTRHSGLALFAGLLIALFLAPTVALGHAELDSASPANTSTVQASPTEIVMTFTEPVVPSKSSIKLIDASGAVIAQGSTVDAGDAKTMRLPITTELAPATYTVRWTTASALDGDLDHGTTTFTVAAAPPSASPVASASATATPAPSAASIAPVAPASVAPSPSAPPRPPAASTSDAIVPIIVALIVLAALGLWLMRGRARVR